MKQQANYNLELLFKRELNRMYIPLSECVNEDAYFEEFKVAPLIPDLTLFLAKNYPNYKAERERELEEEIINKFNRNSTIANFVGNTQSEINSTKFQNEFFNLIDKKQLSKEFYIPSIIETPTYKNLLEINRIYYNSVERVAFEFETIDWYKEPEDVANVLMLKLKNFDELSIINIIEYLKNDNDVIKHKLLYKQKTQDIKDKINENRIKDFELKLNTLLLTKMNSLRQEEVNERPIVNKPLTTAQQVLIFHYIFKSFNLSHVDLTQKARFIQKILGQELNSKSIGNTNIYKKLQSPLSITKTSQNDLLIVRSLFESINLQEVIDKIDKDLKNYPIFR